MDWQLGGIPDWVLTTAVALIMAVLLYVRRQQLGLGDTQLATNLERDRLLALQEQRIELLEKRVAELGTEIKYLHAENRQLREQLREERDDTRD